MKRVISLVLALSMILSMFPCAFAATESLSDITGTKFESSVNALMELGVVNGYPDGTYLPDNVLLRSELTKLLVTAYGLDLAAKSSMGATPYADVNAVGTHWASGYINVSADYKFVNGYPDGTFKADNPVTYAEAITMCLRVLGYANEVESRGTWPTNYIAKAQDLKLMKDISFSSYDEGAKRGDIAILMWNMLRTPMWEVGQESEGDGLISSPDRIMLNVKFPDYEYRDDVLFSNYVIDTNKQGEPVVKVTLEMDKGVEDKLDKLTYEYVDNDFYTFVPGTEVEVLLNTEEETMLTMLPTSDNRIVEGSKEDIDDKYDELSGDTYDYVYARFEGSKIKNETKLTASTDAKENLYVDKFEAPDDAEYVRINGTQYKDNKGDTTSEWLILKDGERATIRDLEVGDVLVKVNVAYNGDQASEDRAFYVIGGEEVTGEIRLYEEENYEDVPANKYRVLTIDSDEYIVSTKATFVENPEAKNIKKEDFYGLAMNTDRAIKMKGEEVTVKLDPMFNKVMRVSFDGKINGEASDTTLKFFGIASPVERESAKVYTVSLVNEEGEEPYTFANTDNGISVAKDIYASTGEWSAVKSEVGCFVAVTLDDENNIEDMKLIARADADGKTTNCKVDATGTEYEYGKGVKEQYVAKLAENAKYDKNNASITISGESDTYIVDSSVVVATLVYDDKGTSRTSDDEYKVEFEEAGVEAAKKIKNDDVIIIYDKADAKPASAMYIILFEKSFDKSETKIGIVNRMPTNIVGSDSQIVIGSTRTDKKDETKDEKYILNSDSMIPSEGDVVAYTTRTNSKDEEEVEIFAILSKAKLDAESTNFMYVSEAKGSRATIVDTDGSITAIYLGDPEEESKSDYQSDYEDYMIVLVETSKDDNVEYSSVDVIEYSVDMLSEDDRIYIDDENEIYYIIRGLEEDKEKETTTVTVEFTPEEATVALLSGDYTPVYTVNPSDDEYVIFKVASGDENTANAKVDEKTGKITFEQVGTVTVAAVMNVKNSDSNNGYLEPAIGTEIATFTLTVVDATPKAPEGTKQLKELGQEALGEKTVSTFQENLTISENGKVEGKMKKVESFDEFSKGASGYFIVLTFEENSVTVIPSSNHSRIEVNDHLLVLQINKQVVEAGLKLDIEVDGVVVRTLDLSGLTEFEE